MTQPPSLFQHEHAVQPFEPPDLPLDHVRVRDAFRAIMAVKCLGIRPFCRKTGISYERIEAYLAGDAGALTDRSVASMRNELGIPSWGKLYERGEAIRQGPSFGPEECVRSLLRVMDANDLVPAELSTIASVDSRLLRHILEGTEYKPKVMLKLARAMDIPDLQQLCVQGEAIGEDPPSQEECRKAAAYLMNVRNLRYATIGAKADLTPSIVQGFIEDGKTLRPQNLRKLAKGFGASSPRDLCKMAVPRSFEDDTDLYRIALLYLLEEKNLTQDALAKELGIATGVVSETLSGKRFNVALVARMAKFFGICSLPELRNEGEKCAVQSVPIDITRLAFFYLMEEKGHSYQTLADKTGFSKDVINKTLNGSNFSSYVVTRMAKAYGADNLQELRRLGEESAQRLPHPDVTRLAALYVMRQREKADSPSVDVKTIRNFIAGKPYNLDTPHKLAVTLGAVDLQDLQRLGSEVATRSETMPRGKRKRANTRRLIEKSSLNHEIESKTENPVSRHAFRYFNFGSGGFSRDL